MKDMSSDLRTGTHCECCGAEFEPRSTPGTRSATQAPAQDAEPVTQCEWCATRVPGTW
jgi:hypothetical protein